MDLLPLREKSHSRPFSAGAQRVYTSSNPLTFQPNHQDHNIQLYFYRLHNIFTKTLSCQSILPSRLPTSTSTSFIRSLLPRLLHIIIAALQLQFTIDSTKRVTPYSPSTETGYGRIIQEDFFLLSNLQENISITSSNLSPPHIKMTIDMDWSPSFCLACDRQTDDKAYCSEACRLAEYDASSNAGSTASSPASPRAPMSWPAAKEAYNGYYMEPTYNFRSSKTSTSSRSSTQRTMSTPVTTKPILSPSNSQSSLFSMQSTQSASTESSQLSEESRRALREYASAFDQSRYSRRQSAH